MDIPSPDYNLNISSLSHGAMTGRMLEGVEEIILKEKPDWLLVYGDTNSTLAAAIAAAKLCVNIAHVEAGLRSFNMSMPEEQNRIITDRLSTILFCPTNQSIDNLSREGFGEFESKIIKSGDVMYDAAIFYGTCAKKPTWFDNLKDLNEFSLATIHREENTDNPNRMTEIIFALNEIHKTTPVIFPLHPRTKNIIKKMNLKLDMHVVDPVGYLEMVYLLDNCKFVLSDSGGVQKESYFFNKQCIVLRDDTEWVELVDNGINKLAGADSNQIISAAESISTNIDFSKKFYGDGNAAELIVSTLVDYKLNLEK
jgi:UDP-GlcNAc3NAcA epimerase